LSGAVAVVTSSAAVEDVSIVSATASVISCCLSHWSFRNLTQTEYLAKCDYIVRYVIHSELYFELIVIKVRSMKNSRLSGNWQSWWCQITQLHTWICSCGGCFTVCNNVGRSSGSSRVIRCRCSCIDYPCNKVSDILWFITWALAIILNQIKFINKRTTKPLMLRYYKHHRTL